jgi:SSS family solute:Na+ symporter
MGPKFLWKRNRLSVINFYVQTEFFLLLGVYFILIVFVGLKFSRRMKSLEDFFLASRSLSGLFIFVSLTASWFGATSILVTTDEAFRIGLSAFWLVGLPAVVTVLIFAFFLAGPIRRLDILTLPDLVELRYGRTVRHLASLLIFWYMVVLASSQMVALGNFFSPFLGISYFWSLVLGTAVVLIYLLSGGLFSVVATDVLQCFLLTAGMIGLAFFLWGASPVETVLEAARQAGKQGYFHFFFDLKRNLLIALSFTLAWTISPIAWQRIQAAKTAKKAKQGLFGAAGAFVVLYSLVVFIGIFSLPLFFDRQLSHPLISEIVASKIGKLWGGLLFIAVVSAILSTMDTALNTGALGLTRDIYLRIFSPQKEKQPSAVWVSRVSTFLVAVLAFAVATRFQSILKTIGVASEIMAEGLFIPGLAMLFLKKKRPLAGGLSLILGGIFALASFLAAMEILSFRLPVWPFSVPYGLALSLIGFAVGFLLDQVRLSRSRPDSV